MLNLLPNIFLKHFFFFISSTFKGGGNEKKASFNGNDFKTVLDDCQLSDFS